MSTDVELVVAAQAGDSRALGQLYDRYAGPLYGFVYRHVDHRQEAEDLTSDVMLRMVKQLPTYRQAASFKTWLFGIARHVIVDYWRGQYRLPTAVLTDVAAASEDTDEPTVDDPRRALAQRVLAQLPEDYRHVLQHRFFEQRTIQETAAALGLTVANVKIIQYRALKKAAELATTMV